jgi:ATP-dependent exoDNAse (exonuclease V) beta subunit
MFQILHSSAGAGKTHSLVKHYLAHCLSGDDPGAYRQVLALTFTNKAAGEMKARVMGYLRKLASGDVNDGAMRDVLEHLERRSGKGRAVIEQRADAVLRHMLHHWSDVAISTIDAFTRRVVRPFARDLQLDHDLQMTTDQDHYLNAAVDGLIGEAGTVQCASRRSACSLASPCQITSAQPIDRSSGRPWNTASATSRSTP